MKFQDMIGQEQLTGHLQNAIRMGKLSHAYIIQGEEGSGKNMLAGIFSTAIQCEEQGIEPCGKCQSCKQAVSGNHPDIRWITHEKASIGVDDIRLQLNNDIMVKPYSRPYKVYIIEEAEKMTEQAQNAMLKTMEEPPEYAVIVLLTVNAKRLLPTILSRCMVLSLRPVAGSAIEKLLVERYGIGPYLAKLSADFADGVPGRAISYASSEAFASQKDEVLRLLKKIGTMHSEELYAQVKQWAGRKQELPELLSVMMRWYRDVLVMKSTKGTGAILFREEENELMQQAEKLDYALLEQKLAAIDRLQQRINANVNFEVSLELFLEEIKTTDDV